MVHGESGHYKNLRENLRIEFESSKGLPLVPQGTRIRCIRFGTCPGSELFLRLVKENKQHSGTPIRGVHADTWWVIETPDLPLRIIRLYRGAHSLQELIRRYGFLDSSGCVHHKHGQVTCESVGSPLPPFDLDRLVPKFAQSMTGVPQFYPRSGVCWFASLCTCFFSDERVLTFLSRFFPQDMMENAKRSMFDREAAERLRKQWWYDFSVGDNVDDPPEKDGRNGFSEWMTLCAKLNVPMLCYENRGERMVAMSGRVRDRKGKQFTLTTPARGEAHLMALRYIDGDHEHKFPVERRVKIGNAKYRLLGTTSGNRKCGHQIGWCTLGSWRRIMAGDADLHKDGIGPLFIAFEGSRWNGDWWEGCRQMLHIAKFGSGMREFCSMSPWNLSDGAHDEYRGAKPTPGSLSVDAIYMFDRWETE